MAATPQIPEDVHADYANAAARSALHALQATPDYEHLAAFLEALREGYLVVDVSGASGKKQGHRIRTIRSTRGQLVLPLFTSMGELRAVVPADRRDQLKGAVMPAREALALISSDRFVAAEFDKASASLVVLRKYVSLAAGDEPITAASLESMR
ncbi:SseB family protein [Leucobacter zeae]|nr:SseB family protein [Leucobacter zeae]